MGPGSTMSSALRSHHAITRRSPFHFFETSAEIIRLPVMLYVRFPLPFRNVEDPLYERDVEICNETVRY